VLLFLPFLFPVNIFYLFFPFFLLSPFFFFPFSSPSLCYTAFMHAMRRGEGKACVDEERRGLISLTNIENEGQQQNGTFI